MKYRIGTRKQLQERGLKDAALSLLDEARCRAAGGGKAGCLERTDVLPLLEDRLVSAAWTLRRLPDREARFLKARGSWWPEMQAEAGAYANEGMTSFTARHRVRITAQEIDVMQPSLDMLLLLPDREDRQLLFWAAWHQNGERLARIPWAKVRRSLGGNLSRWTLKRRYEAGLEWLAGLVLLQGS
ncbi:MAG: hypothetical protein HWE25_03020 [Alphaproteobacteria bacterium]|nr:hypothetical protein [Alphaproteobacteria bacterium]